MGEARLHVAFGNALSRKRQTLFSKLGGLLLSLERVFSNKRGSILGLRGGGVLIPLMMVFQGFFRISCTSQGSPQ